MIRFLEELPAWVPGRWLFSPGMIAVGWGNPVRGVALLVPEDYAVSRAHIAVIPDARGKEAVRMGREIIAWVRDSGIQLVGSTPCWNRAALRYAALVGFKRTGIKNGEVQWAL